MAHMRARAAAAAMLALLWLPQSAAADTALAEASGLGRALAVWDDGDGVHAQLLDGAGSAPGRPLRLAASPARSPDVAYNASTREFLVVWERAGAVHGARVGALGGLLASRRISEPGAPAADPRVAANPGDGYLVVWELLGPDATIAGRRLDPLGLELGGDRELAQVATGRCRPGPLSGCNPDVAYGAGAYLLAWHEDVASDDFEDEVFALRLGDELAPLGRRFQVSSAGHDPADAIFTQATNPALAWNATSGEFLVAWEAFASRPRREEQEIAGQRVRADGALAGVTTRLSEAPGGPLEAAPSDVELAGLRDGGWRAVWEERTGQGAGLRVRSAAASPLLARAGALDATVAARGQDPAVAAERIVYQAR